MRCLQFCVRGPMTREEKGGAFHLELQADGRPPITTKVAVEMERDRKRPDLYTQSMGRWRGNRWDHGMCGLLG
jgi:hypothetical protein